MESIFKLTLNGSSSKNKIFFETFLIQDASLSYEK